MWRFLEYEEFAQFVGLLAQHNAATHLGDLSLEQRLVVVVVEKVDVARTRLVETVLYGDIVDNCLSSVDGIATCADLAAYDDADTVAPESLSEAEAIVGC